MENLYGRYTIIPANVRYDKNLTPNAKLLYGDILSVMNVNKECFLTNAEFAGLANMSKALISKTINSLKKRGYIVIEIILENKQIVGRKITVRSLI